MAAGSTSELAPLLDRARKQFPLHVLVLIVAGAITALALGYDLKPLAGAALALGLVAWLIVFAIDRRRRTTTLEYNLHDDQNEAFSNLVRAFDRLKSCHRAWRVPFEWAQQDWKRNAGASATIEREPISLRMGLPSLVKSNLEFPSFPFRKRIIYFAPDAILVVSRNSVAALRYDDCVVGAGTTRFIESNRPPADAQVVGETWQYVNKSGGPDRRFSNNRKLPICLYGQIDLKSTSGLNERLHCSRSDVVNDFAAAVLALRQTNVGYIRGAGLRSENFAQSGHNAVEDQAGEETAAAFANESDYARTLALKHGQFWEFLLIEELLRSRLLALNTECEELERTHLSVPRMPFDGAVFMSWLGDEMNVAASAVSRMASCINEDLPHALGKPGVSGNAIQMLRTVDALFEACRSILAFERDLRAADPPKELESLKSALGGITRSVAGVLEQFAEDWDRAVEHLRNGSHEFQINVVFTPPPQLERASAEMKKISRTRQRRM